MSVAREWRVRYSRRLRIIDGVAVTWAVVGAYLIRFGLDGHQQLVGEDRVYAVFAAVLTIAWWTMLGYWGARESLVLGSGSEEYKRVLAASSWLFGFVAVFSYALKIDVARGFVGLAFPAGVLALLCARWIVRQHLNLERKKGLAASRVLLIGGPFAAEHLAKSLRSQPAAGYRPVAAHLPGWSPSSSLAVELDVPVVGSGTSLEEIIASVEEAEVDAVAISAGVQLHPRELRRLGWLLAAKDVSMILAPALTDVAGPRIHTQPVAGLPLIHVSTPKLTGGKRVAKRTFDVVGASAIILLLSPVLLVLILLVRFSSPGPVFYKQERIGIRGSRFNMLKFRSMIVDADRQLAALLEKQGSADKPLFKVDNDPRITPVGKVLRKFSLDELPQLFNVLSGSMSLVGPRPQREGEVALYDDDAHRRLYVSPGMSGLWQVSGRSNLSWEESIRLDLYYVENWSLMGDIVILLKTFKAVFASTGAR